MTFLLVLVFASGGAGYDPLTAELAVIYMNF
jgi:hypothetical protein